MLSANPTSTPKAALGRKGEQLALKFLKKQGCRCLAKNYTISSGEVDLIVQDNDTVVFVEVKTRRTEDFTAAEHAVNYGKQRRIELAARHFIAKNNLYNHPCRFDTIAVILPEDSKPTLRHHPNAFQAKF